MWIFQVCIWFEFFFSHPELVLPGFCLEKKPFTKANVETAWWSKAAKQKTRCETPSNLCNVGPENQLLSLNRTARTLKLVVRRRSFRFGARPIFTGDLLVSGSANITSSPSTQEGRTVLWLNDTWWTPFVLGLSWVGVFLSQECNTHP